MTIAVSAHLKARPGTEAELERALRSLVAPSRTHRGCIQYQLHTSADDPTHFFFYEQWDDQASLDEHLADDQLSKLAKRIDELKADVDMRLFALAQ